VFIRPDGRRVDGRIWIGLPERVDEREARCSFGIDGLHERLQPVSGNDTLQALLLAVRLGATLLQHFREEGGRIVRPGDDRSVDLEPYFGTLVRPTSAFTEEELDWTRPDVAAVFSFHGLATTTPADRDQLGNWLRKHGYTLLSIACSKGEREVRRQLGEHLRWVDRFGYPLEGGNGNLDALRDGFDFAVPQPGGLVLELLEPDAAWSSDARWFEGLLAIASEHARYHLALGRRFFTMLVVDDKSPLIGKVIDGVTIPYPTKTPDASPDRV
jgi:hypothetical protein